MIMNKNKLKKRTKKEKKCDILGDNEKEQLRKYKKKGKKVMHDNLYDENKEHLKKRTTKVKKKSMIILMKKRNIFLKKKATKEQLKTEKKNSCENTRKEERKLCVIASAIERWMNVYKLKKKKKKKKTLWPHFIDGIQLPQG